MWNFTGEVLFDLNRFKTSLSYETEFDLHENEAVAGTFFHINGWALGLVFIETQKLTRKWTIVILFPWYHEEAIYSQEKNDQPRSWSIRCYFKTEVPVCFFFFTMSVLKLKQKDTKYCHFVMFPLFRSGFLQDFLHSIFSSSQCLMDYNIEGKITEYWLAETEGIFP